MRDVDNLISFFFLLAFGVFLLAIVGGVIFLVNSAFNALADMFTTPPAPPPAPPPSAEQYDQAALQYRAEARALDAKAALDDSAAKAALKQIELQEVNDFVRQQSGKRGGRR